MEMLKDVPSPVFQVQKGFGAQLFGDPSTVQEVLHRFGSRPELLIRSMTGDHLLRDFADMVARAGAKTYAMPAYRALLPYAGLLNVAGGHSAGLPVDDVLGRLAALNGDVPSAVRHAADAVALARSMPSPPLLVHCLDHLADALERAGDGDLLGALRVGPDEGGPETRMSCAPRPTASPPPRVSCGPADRPGRHERRRIRRSGRRCVGMDPCGWSPHRWAKPDCRTATACDNWPGCCQRPLSKSRPLSSRATRTARSPLISAPDSTPGRSGTTAAGCMSYRPRSIPPNPPMIWCEPNARTSRWRRCCRELKRAVGLGGRDRPTGSDAERARINVVRSIRRTIEAIDRQAPLLGAHLQESVRTGRHCIYLPEPGIALSWAVTAGDTSPS